MGTMTTWSKCMLRLTAVAATATAALATMATADCEPRWDQEIGQPGLEISVLALAVFDDGSGPALFAGGQFNTFGAQPYGLARWNGSAWTAVSGAEIALFGGVVRSLAVYDDGSGPALYVGGDFEDIGGLTANGLAKYDGTTWSAVGSGVSDSTFPTASVDAMAVYDDGSGDLLFIGGIFDSINGVTARGIARYNGSTYDSLGTGFTSSGPGLPAATTMVVHDDGFGPALFVGGTFSSVSGIVAPRIARWNGVWSPVGTGVDEVPGGFFTAPSVTSLASFNGDLYASGLFNTAGGVSASRIARWDGSSWSPVGSGLSSLAESMVVFDDSTGPALFVGGLELSTTGSVDNYILKWDGSQWSQLDGGVDQIVEVMLPFNDGSGPALIVGGIFDSADGDPATSVAMWRGCGDLPDAALSDVTVDRSVISSYAGRATITVTPRDEAGAIMAAGLDVSISTTAGTLLGSVQDLGDGTYIQELEGVVGPEQAVITVQAGGVTLDDSPTVAFVPVDPSQSTVAVNKISMFIGGTATITVTPRDDQGSLVGSGLDVVISTTLGGLGAVVSDNGDGTYSQAIGALSAGTAAITATVDGLALDSSASLTVLDPLNFGAIVGVASNGDIVAYMSIQEAVNAADGDDLDTVFITPGSYAETVLIENSDGLVIEALSANEPVQINGFIVSESNNVSLRYFEIDATDGAKDAVTIRGRQRSSTSVEIVGSTITGASFQGINVEGGNTDVVIRDSLIYGNGRNGVELSFVPGPFGTSGPYLIENCEIRDNGHNGIAIGRDVTVTLSNNVIVNNGTVNGQGGGRYGVARDRMPGGGDPQQVTLLNNTIEDNNGRVRNGQSDENVENYDQIIDATDDQSPYTD